MKGERLNDEARRQWISSDEGLYLAFRGSRMLMPKFIRLNRKAIDEVIVGTRDGKIPQHYLAYGGRM